MGPPRGGRSHGAVGLAFTVTPVVCSATATWPIRPGFDLFLVASSPTDPPSWSHTGPHPSLLASLSVPASRPLPLLPRKLLCSAALGAPQTTSAPQPAVPTPSARAGPGSLLLSLLLGSLRASCHLSTSSLCAQQKPHWATSLHVSRSGST